MERLHPRQSLLPRVVLVRVLERRGDVVTGPWLGLVVLEWICYQLNRRTDLQPRYTSETLDTRAARAPGTALVPDDLLEKRINVAAAAALGGATEFDIASIYASTRRW